MAQKKLLQEVIYGSLQHNLHQIQEKYEYFKGRLDLSMYPDKVATFHSCYKSIGEDTDKFVSLVKEGQCTEAKNFYYQTYKKDFEAILPLIDFFSFKSIERSIK